MGDEFVTFRKFLPNEDADLLAACEKGAKEKLETLYPLTRIKAIDSFSITIESDSLYAVDGYEVYLIGLIDEEVPALQRTTDGHIIPFRV